jgi:CheY-like chemotaxis protein
VTTRILLVEDEELVRILAAEALRDAGFEVVEAATGDEAAKCLVDPDEFDVLVTDVRMPGRLDGIDVAARARMRDPSIGVVVVSGFAPQVIERLKTFDPVPVFISKPYRTGEVIGVIQKLAA